MPTSWMGGDVGVLEAADRADLVDEAGQEGGVGHLRGGEALQGDLALVVAVAHQPPDLAHAARAEELGGSLQHTLRGFG